LAFLFGRLVCLAS